MNAKQAKRQRYLEQRRNRDSENAQAATEVASQDRDSDPQPGAFYGLPDPDTNHLHLDSTHTDPTHA